MILIPKKLKNTRIFDFFNIEFLDTAYKEYSNQSSLENTTSLSSNTIFFLIDTKDIDHDIQKEKINHSIQLSLDIKDSIIFNEQLINRLVVCNRELYLLHFNKFLHNQRTFKDMKFELLTFVISDYDTYLIEKILKNNPNYLKQLALTVDFDGDEDNYEKEGITLNFFWFLYHTFLNTNAEYIVFDLSSFGDSFLEAKTIGGGNYVYVHDSVENCYSRFFEEVDKLTGTE